MFARKEGWSLSNRPILSTVVCVPVSETRVSEPWPSRVSLPDGGEMASDQMTVVIWGTEQSQGGANTILFQKDLERGGEVQENLREDSILDRP